MGPGSEALQGRPECLLNTHETLRSRWGFWSARTPRGRAGEHRVERARRSHRREVAPFT